jgi:hypothetical protein
MGVGLVPCADNSECDQDQGLLCRDGVCRAGQDGEPCGNGIACDEGLICTLEPTNVCQRECNPAAAQCKPGLVCTPTYDKSIGYEFDFDGGLDGVCDPPQAGAGLGQPCTLLDNYGRSTCAPSLICIPDSSTTSVCRSFCDPAQPGSCAAPDQCHALPGSEFGQVLGACYPDNGFGAACQGQNDCPDGFACTPYDRYDGWFEWSADVCEFSRGAKAGLAPCQHDWECASGICPLDFTPVVCFAPCTQDTDCLIGNRYGACTGLHDIGSAGLSQSCNPSCRSNADCVEYNGVCRFGLQTSGSATARYFTNCGDSYGGVKDGNACSGSFVDCISGTCLDIDGRGVQRRGYCSTPCLTSADCLQPGDVSGPLDCLPTSVFVTAGADNVKGNNDDQVTILGMCSGVPCHEDADCSSDGGARCVPDVGASFADALILHCRPSTTAMLEAGAPCMQDAECASGACGLADSSNDTLCFSACSPGGTLCPGSLSCRAGAFRFVSASGKVSNFDGCAP